MLNTVIHGDDNAQPPPPDRAWASSGRRGTGVLWAKRLSDTRRVLTVDMRNHGDSFRDDSHDYPDLAADLAEVIAAHGGVADVVGHSMGGKAGDGARAGPS